MAANSTISVTFKVTDADGSWKKLSGDAAGFKKIVESTLQPVDNLQKKVINWTAASQALGNMQTALSNLQGFMSGLTGAYETQIQNETRLATVMKQRMGATDEEIQSIKDLASAQQEVGVIGDEVQLAGLQQIATFVNQKSSLEKLAPAMNNLIAQQKGLNATTQDAQSIGNLFGKAMQGNISALSKVGITFSEAEGNVIKYGTEEEKAAMLAQVITQNVGNMNQELAQTDAGQQKQMANAMGDMQEKIGGMLEPIAGVVGALTQMGQTSFAITQLVTSFGAVGTALKGVINLQALYAVGAKAAAAASAVWRGAQFLLNAVLSANPIGVVVMAISGLVTALVLAYKHSESFRQVCNGVWKVTKNLASMVWDKLCKAFDWLGQKLKVVWTFIKGIFGIKDDPFVNITTGAKDAGTAIDELTDKCNCFNKQAGKGNSGRATINGASVEKGPIEGSIAYYEQRMQEAQKAVSNAVTTEARIAAQKMADDFSRQIDRIKMQMNGGALGEGFKPAELAVSNFAEQIKKLEGVKIPKEISQLWKSGDNTKDSWKNAAQAIQQAGSAMQNMGSPVLNVMGTIAQAVASIALGYATATAQAAEMGPWAWIAFAATGLATTIAMISSIKNATAFADGGVLYGPTLALMGEYQGARNNPEVIAPLNKLQSIIGGTGGGQVEFKLRGRELVGLISNENSRSGKIR